MKRAGATRLIAGAVLLVACGACGSRGSSVRSAARAPSLAVDRGELVLTTSDGRELRSAELVGATLEVGESTVRLDGVVRDSVWASHVLLHRFTLVSRRGDSAEAPELCMADPDGQRWVLVVQAERGGVELVCSSGAIGKCIRWGYPPWPSAANQRPARVLHEACVRMVRADYGGDGATATRDGTRISFCDLGGVHPCPPGDHDIEAAWTSDGAVCVARPRIPDLITLDELGRRYPKLEHHRGAACTMTAAAADPRTVLFSFVPAQ